MSKMNLLQVALSLEQEIVDVRRHLHQYPELGFQEFITSAYVAEQLERLGLEVQRGVAGTGVVALLETGRPGPCIAVRADMDALPLQERTGLPYASRHEGAMHACGHDGHMAMALGAARMLTGLKRELIGTVKFIFQPAEEMLGGARHMIDAGVLDSPRVDGIIGLHLWPDLPTGCFGVKAGTIMASMDHVDITIHGRSGHGAAPHQGVDAIIAAAHVLTALQVLISRESDPADAVVLSMGTIHGGSIPNIIADEVEIRGTVRAVNSAARERMRIRVTELAQAVAAGMNARADVRYEFGYPPTVNDGQWISFAEEALRELYGQEAIHRLAHAQMTSEDMAYYMEHIPGAFLLVGTGGAGKGRFPLHHPELAVDEQSLIYGAAYLAQFVRNYLRDKN
ncbi:M20 metallopeptidase family protein [Paenibacillus woosongensis]|uniref:Peptidase M20 n=1 Tax=Paenibacillus woosongensis TaxID=307580 RepID=A0ABQ4MK90_9BACL|nr:M20 family metallopeptidase [Paenibacillus woosongensis]GIP56406.1 peptidase M20 [Paenibacillus woosongensis]